MGAFFGEGREEHVLALGQFLAALHRHLEVSGGRVGVEITADSKTHRRLAVLEVLVLPVIGERGRIARKPAIGLERGNVPDVVELATVVVFLGIRMIPRIPGRPTHVPLDDEQLVVVVDQVEFMKHIFGLGAESAADVTKEFHQDGSLNRLAGNCACD